MQLSDLHSTIAFGKAADDAPGLPSRQDLGDLSRLRVGQLIDWLIQHHQAIRSGPHYDVRFGTPETGLYSWATKHELPEPGQRRALFQQPVHRYGYKNFEGVIPKGYGAGTVRRHAKGQILITNVEPGKVEFTTAHERYPQRFTMIQPPAWKHKDWLLINTTPREAVPYEKVRYKRLAGSEIDKYIEQMKEGDTLESKIDGASSLIKLMKDGVELVSYRTSKTTGRPIVHTERFFGDRGKMQIPPELAGTVLKGELHGRRGDEVIGPQELGGILNASLAEALRKQQEGGINLQNMVYDIQQLGKKPIDWHKVPRLERRKMIEQVLQHLPQDKFHISPAATTSDAARKLWEQIKSTGYSPATEGVVAWPRHGTPAKSKLMEDQDVHITGTFPGEGRLASQGVGGFTYSLEPGGPVAGRVGTGLSDELRREAFADPDAFTGRVARIRAQQQFPSGAYRAPALIAFHEDYPDAKVASDLIAPTLGDQSHGGNAELLTAPEEAEMVEESQQKGEYQSMPDKIAEMCKRAKDLQALLSQAELMGSRGRARRYGRPEPADRDYDYTIFTDDPQKQQQLLQQLRDVAAVRGYKMHDRPDGFLTISGDNRDISVYPEAKRQDIHSAWALQEGGLSKDDAWAQIEQNKLACNDIASFFVKDAHDRTKHVLITGHSGAGKSTLAKQLSNEWQMPLYRLDRENPEWDEFMKRDSTMQHHIPGTPERDEYEALRRRIVGQALELPTPHIIEGTQLLGTPDLWGDHRLILVDPSELQVVRQRMQRDRGKPERAGKMPPGSAFARERAGVAKTIMEGYRDDIAKAREHPGVEFMRAKAAEVAPLRPVNADPEFIERNKEWHEAEKQRLANAPDWDHELVQGFANLLNLGPIKQAAEEGRRPSVAVDLDGTLAKDLPDFDPEVIGDPRPGAKKWMDELQETGARIIVHTCRGNPETVEAWLKKHDIPFDNINENPDQPPDTSDKLYADVYFDNRAVSAEGPLHKTMPEVLDRVKESQQPIPSLWTGLALPIGVNTNVPLWKSTLVNQAINPAWDADQPFGQNILNNLGQARSRMRQAVSQHDATEDLRTALQPGYGMQRVRRFLREGDAVQDPIDRLLTRGF